MKTQTQDRKVVDVLDQAAADPGKYGQKLSEAVTKAYFAAKEDDTKTVAQAFSEASEHQEKLNEAMARVQAAVSDLTGVPAERTLQ